MNGCLAFSVAASLVDRRAAGHGGQAAVQFFMAALRTCTT